MPTPSRRRWRRRPRPRTSWMLRNETPTASASASEQHPRRRQFWNEIKQKSLNTITVNNHNRATTTTCYQSCKCACLIIVIIIIFRHVMLRHITSRCQVVTMTLHFFAFALLPCCPHFKKDASAKAVATRKKNFLNFFPSFTNVRHGEIKTNLVAVYDHGWNVCLASEDN